MNRTFEETETPRYVATGWRVSWGAILAGAVTALAVALLLWTLALAITLSSAHASVGSLKDSALALWICAMGATLVGAFVGGTVSGYWAASPGGLVSSISHALLAWCVAFLVGAAVDWALIRGTASSTASALLSAVQTTGAAALAGPATLEQRAEEVLTELGYPRAQARKMIDNAQRELQATVQGQSGPTTQGKAQEPSRSNQVGGGPNTPSTEQARGTLDKALDWSAGLTWSFFGTWVLSAVLAVLGGAIVAQRERRRLGQVGGPARTA